MEIQSRHLLKNGHIKCLLRVNTHLFYYVLWLTKQSFEFSIQDQGVSSLFGGWHLKDGLLVQDILCLRNDKLEGFLEAGPAKQRPAAEVLYTVLLVD